jgi:hypothetical protein
MEKPPRLLNIFGKGFPIVREDIIGSHNSLGLFDNEKIILDISLDGDELIQTELHELIHAVAERTGLTRTSINGDLWEVLCENIARAIVENYKLGPI